MPPRLKREVPPPSRSEEVVSPLPSRREYVPSPSRREEVLLPFEREKMSLPLKGEVPLPNVPSPSKREVLSPSRKEKLSPFEREKVPLPLKRGEMPLPSRRENVPQPSRIDEVPKPSKRDKVAPPVPPHSKKEIPPPSKGVPQPLKGNEDMTLGALECLKKHREKVQKAATLDMSWLANEMNTNGLLSDTTYQEVRNPRSMLSMNEKTSEMVRELETLVDIRPENLSKFVGILRQKSYYNDIVELLVDENSSED